MSIQFNLKAQKIFLGNKEILGVYKGNKKIYEKIGIPAYYVRVSSADFDTSGNYTGTEEYIILPSNKPSGYKITNSNVKGVATNGDYLTDASNMFNSHTGLYLELDYLDTSNVTSMASIFNGSQATTLDLSSFDTSKVISMSNMFSYNKATTLDLSNFDTSKVISMFAMFSDSQATTLDLSSFDTSKVTQMRYMFTRSKATKGYAKTQADADKFNSVDTERPTGLRFVVK